MTTIQPEVDAAKPSNLAQVKLRLQASGMPEARLSRYLEALELLSNLTSTPLEEIAATPAAIRRKFKNVRAKGLIQGLNLSLARRRCLLALSALPGAAHPDKLSRRVKASPAWKLLLATPDVADRRELSMFARWCTKTGIEPLSVGAETFAGFRLYIDTCSQNAEPQRLFRRSIIAWNRLVNIHPERGLSVQPLPAVRRPNNHIQISSFSPSLQAELRACIAYWRCENPAAPGARRRAMSSRTVSGKLSYISRALRACARLGERPEEIQSLVHLLEVERFRSICRMLNDDANDEPSFYNHFTLVTLLQIAEWLQVPDEQLQHLRSIAGKLPRVSFRMTTRNKALVGGLMDDGVFKRLMNAPAAIIADARSQSPQTDLSMTQCLAGVAIGLLLRAPLRIENLASLRIDETLLWRDGGNFALSIPAEETKGNVHLYYPLEGEIASILREYIDKIGPGFTGKPIDYLFSYSNGRPRSVVSLREMIKRYTAIYVGVEANPHIFRHLWAEIILDDKPGAYIMVKQFLGHKNLQVTRRYYRDTDPRTAVRRHTQLVHRRVTFRNRIKK